MTRRSKARAVPSNWENEPDPTPPSEGSSIEPGDMVRPLVSLHILGDDKDRLDDHAVTKVVHDSRFLDADGSPTVDGEPYGIYVGQKRLRTPRAVVSHTKHWTGSRKIDEVYTMHHICVFCGRRVVVKLEHIAKVQ